MNASRAAALALAPALLALAPARAAEDPVLPWMESKLEELAPELASRAEDPVLQLQLFVEDAVDWTVAADRGSLVSEKSENRRTLQANVVLGDSAFSSRRPLYWDETVPPNPGSAAALPADAFSEKQADRAVRQAFFWALQGARAHFARLKSERNALVAEENAGLDLAPAAKADLVDTAGLAPVDSAARALLRGRILALSRRFLGIPWLHRSGIELSCAGEVARKAFSGLPATRDVRRLCDLNVTVATSTDDGMILAQNRTWSFASVPRDVDTAAVGRAVDSLLLRLDSLRGAKVGEPYAGPVILDGPAAAVYVHEVLGHRLESHRLRKKTDGQTFLRKRGESVAAPEFSLVDDPTVAEWDGEAVHGFYRVDEEGTPARRAELVRDGKLIGFLDGRATLSPEDSSNGHGRGFPQISRMGTTILATSKPVPREELRARFLKALAERGLPYGLVVHDLQEGYTLTGRSYPQTFRLHALSATRVWADGRPDELVRGVNLSGSPLSSLAQLVAASDRMSLFNGWCGAENGWVPVSSIAPDLLFATLEAEIQPTRSVPKPQLPPPEEKP